MSYYRNGQPHQPYNAPGNAAFSLPQDEYDAEPGSEVYGSNMNGQPDDFSYSGLNHLPNRLPVVPPHVAGPRAPRLQATNNLSAVSVNGSASPQYIQPQYISPVQGPYNPRDYAQASSPARAGASYSPPRSAAPPQNYSPLQYPRYEPARYQTGGNYATQLGYGTHGGSLATNTPISAPIQNGLYLPAHPPYSSLQGHYAPTTMQVLSDQQYHRSSDVAYTRSDQPAPLPPSREPGRPMLSNAQRSPASNASNSQVNSPLYTTNSHNHSDAPSHSMFENPIDYSTYPSTPEYGGTTPPAFLQDPSPLYGEQLGQRRPLERAGTTGRHPQARPLPGPPLETDHRQSPSFLGHNVNEFYTAEELAQQELYAQVENAVGASTRNSPSPHRTVRHSLESTYASTNSQYNSPTRRRSNGFRGLTGQISAADYDNYSDESDAEAAAGVAAMQQAALDEAESLRRRRGPDSHTVNGISRQQVRTPDTGHQSEEDDYGAVDMSTFSGGFPVQMSYGGAPVGISPGRNGLNGRSPSQRESTDMGHLLQSRSARSSMGRDADLRLGRSSSGVSATESPLRGSYAEPSAYIDQSGTGGFSEPGLGPRKLSFDEGDEFDYIDDQAVAGADLSSLGNGPPMNHSRSSASVAHRPLPPPPLEERPSYLSPHDTWGSPSWMPSANFAYPNPDSYAQVPLSTNGGSAQRSVSLTAPSMTSQLRLPDRSKTDAEERKRTRRISSYGGESATSDGFPSQPSPRLGGPDLPTLPSGRRFQPAKLTTKDFDQCLEPWALSSVVAWLRHKAEGENDLRRDALSEALLALFIHKVPNLHIADAETLATQVVGDMFDAGVLLREEEWLKFGEGSCSGVIYQLTGRGCYSEKVHVPDAAGRCYSYACQRTIRKIDLQGQMTKQTQGWADFHGLTKVAVNKSKKTEVLRQNNLHEIVTTEQTYIDDLNTLRSLYRDRLRNANPPIIAPKKLPGFLDAVFGKLDQVLKANEQFLLPQLKYRQKEQGPWIVGFSDIFRDWIRKAKAAYIDYAANYARAYHLMKQEEERNTMFYKFCDGARADINSRKLSWDTFLKLPITRLQRYGLQLKAVLQNMTTESGPEVTNLQAAIDEVKAVTMDCDNRFAEEDRKVKLVDLESKLILRPEMKHVELNLTHRGREVLFRGELQRTGHNKFTWLETSAILLDNYLILAKGVQHRDAAGGPKSSRYDVSKMPIPMDLLVLESTDDDAVVKSSVKGIATVSVIPPKSSNTLTTVRTNSNSAVPGVLTHTNTTMSLTTVDSVSSTRTMVNATSLERDNRDERILYPFRIKHLGRETYTLYASKAEDRRKWCDSIIQAKFKHASSLYRQSAEPFRLRVLADAAFSYDTSTGSQKSVLIKGTPLSRAIDDIERTYSSVAKPGPICRARVNCATTFVQPQGKKMMAVGTDYGVYVAEVGDARGWMKAIQVLKVTQITVLEEFNLVLLISDKALIAYHLDVVCPSVGAPTPNNNSTHKAPQKLSGHKDVGFFATGRMKDRTLVFYKKKDGLQSTFKILEPILQRATERKSRLLHRGTTEFFREYDDFYIPTECIALDLFTSTLAVATSKGFEVLNLEKKTPFSVPDLKQPHVATIAARLAGVDPVAMFRLSEVELLCVYEQCAVYINKHGDVSRKFVLEFVAKAKAAALEAGFLILFDADFVEIRDTQNGRLKQVIPGRDVRCIDNGRGGGGASRTIKFALQHPEQDRAQIVAELVLNQGTEF